MPRSKERPINPANPHPARRPPDLAYTCEHDADFLSALRTVTFFGSPLNGSPLAPYAKLLGLADIRDGLGSLVSGILPGSYAIREALEPGGPQLRMLQTWNKSIRDHVPLPPVQVYQASGDQVVGPLGVNAAWEGDQLLAMALDHTRITKLNSTAEWDNSAFVDALKTALSK